MFEVLEKSILYPLDNSNEKLEMTVEMLFRYLLGNSNSISDHQILQQELDNLQKWARDWGMKFNAKKCYFLSTKTKSSHFYTVDDHILQQVQDNPYLGITISDDLRWGTHINKSSKKANSTIGFLRRNPRHCPPLCRKNAYLALVRSKLEYGSVVWDLYLKCGIDRLERVQRSAARFITGDYKSRQEGCVTKMLTDLDCLV